MNTELHYDSVANLIMIKKKLANNLNNSNRLWLRIHIIPCFSKYYSKLQRKSPEFNVYIHIHIMSIRYIFPCL